MCAQKTCQFSVLSFLLLIQISKPNLIPLYTHSHSSHPPSLSVSVSLSLFIYELMSKCKLHKLLHIFPRRTENCFQIDANICGERKILQIAKRKLVWNSIFSRWFICFIILFANFTEIWQSYFEIKNNFMLIKSEWKSRIKCCRNFRYFFLLLLLWNRDIFT